MAKFITELHATLLDNDKIWEIDSVLGYDSDLIDELIEAPKGFQTDFASIPRLPIVYTLFGDTAHREAVIHDYLYRKNSVPVVTKAVADEIFYEAMKVRGKPFYVRYPIYWGVVIGGGISYHKRKVEDKLCY